MRHDPLGDAEVGQVQVVGVIVVVAALDQQVSRLDVPVHKPLGVRGVQRPRGLAQQEHGDLRLEPAAFLYHLPQISTGYVPHYDVQQPVARPHVVNGNDVRMVHRSRDARFLEEARAEYIVAGQFGCQHLDRDNVTESRMLRLKDDAHAAAAENRPQAVTGELVADKRKFGHVQLLPTRDRCPVRDFLGGGPQPHAD